MHPRASLAHKVRSMRPPSPLGQLNPSVGSIGLDRAQRRSAIGLNGGSLGRLSIVPSRARSEMSEEDPKTRAETLKAEGNAALQHFKFATAIELYTAAIELFPTAIYYANRAAAHMRTESYGLAIEDASSAIATDPNYIKGANMNDRDGALAALVLLWPFDAGSNNGKTDPMGLIEYVQRTFDADRRNWRWATTRMPSRTSVWSCA